MSSENAHKRRFRVLKCALLAAGLILAGRVVQLQVLLHDEYLARGKDQWTRMIPVEADRGDIFDCQGRPLALSITAWRVGVSSKHVKDIDKVSALLADVLDRKPAEIKKRIRSAKGGHVVVSRRVVLTRAQKQALSCFPEVTTDDLRSRVYPADGVGASLLGFYRHNTDQDLATGLELGLNEYLSGTPGRAQEIETGRVGQNLGYIELAKARHGQSLVLTVDTDLQSICERQLAASVAECGAIGGSVLVLSPTTGDILAAASWPLLGSRSDNQTDPAVWNNRNFTAQYEPGSVFKIFSTASLLSNAAIDTATVFDCSNGDFGRYTIRNSDGHSYGNLSLLPAFHKSSNIYFARAVENLSKRELYRDLVDFGFGQGTLLPYPGQVDGMLSAPSRWSGRSKPTIAIGQEVAVSPLQLGLAVCAVANGGTLYAPRIVKQVKSTDGQVVEAFSPVPLRQVLTEPLADLLRQAMGGVVSQGTGAGAQLDWISVGGKTGTAQKSRDGFGYTQGAYIASFAGMVPVEDPQLVLLTILDEPDGYRHYAAQSAVPLFKRIVQEIRQSTHWLTGLPGSLTRPLPAAGSVKMVQVPDVQYLDMYKAVHRLTSAGLAVAGAEREGVVVQQVPAAGARCRQGQEIRLTVAGRTQKAAVVSHMCPSFLGLSNRQVRSLAARLGLQVDIRGVGYVVSQSHPAGHQLAGRKVEVKMGGLWN